MNQLSEQKTVRSLDSSKLTRVGIFPFLRDRHSEVDGPVPEEAAVIRALTDSYDDLLRKVGLELDDATVVWKTDQSAEQVYDRLRGMRLISDSRSLPSFFRVD